MESRIKNHKGFWERQKLVYLEHTKNDYIEQNKFTLVSHSFFFTIALTLS